MKKLTVIFICLLTLAACRGKKHKQGDDRTNNEFYAEYVRIYKAYGTEPLDSTEAALKAYLVKFPNNNQAWAFMGKVYLDRGQYDKAQSAYRTALQYSAKYGPAMSGLGTIYNWSGRADSALIWLKAAVANGDSTYSNYVGIAIADLKKGDSNAAKEIMRLAPIDSVNDELLRYAVVINGELKDQTQQKKAMAILAAHSIKDSLLDMYISKKMKAMEYFDEKRKQKSDGK